MGSLMSIAGASSLGLPAGQAAVHELFFAGVAFRLECGSAGLAAFVARELAALPCAQSAAAPGEAPLAACTLALGGERALVSGVAERALEWSWQGSECTLQTASAYAALAAEGEACSGRAALAPRPGSLEGLLSAVAAALLYRGGGAVLHAAGIELGGGVVAFVGPSGAGKSTAARHSAAPLFAVDRLALLPPREPGAAWLACALPGGTREEGDRASSRELVLPLRAVLRVGGRSASPVITPLERLRAIALVRAALFQGTRRRQDEQRLLDCATALVQALPCAELSFALGSALEQPIVGWLERAEAQR